MHIIAPDRYQPKTVPRRRKPYLRIVLLLILAVTAVNYLRPLPEPVARLSLRLPATASDTAIGWPAGGQASIAAAGYGVLGTSGQQMPLATASIAKVITALCVLQKQPLAVGQSGPTYTIDTSDVALYNRYAAQDGSVLPVVEGETLTEYQALEALLLPSANNIADSLVVKVFGSQAAYAAYATNFLQQHSLTQTRIGNDASGFDPSTTSTASDLAQLGLLALKSPLLMSIAGESSTELPVVGTVRNYDTLLGNNGITGLKTGNNDADPGAFLFTANTSVGGKTLSFTGAVMDATDLDTALRSSSQLVTSLRQGFAQTTITEAGQQLGSLQTAWSVRDPIITPQTVSIIRWKAAPLSETHQLRTDVRSGSVGNLQITAGQAQVKATLYLQHALKGPSFWWRLTRH